MTKDPRVPSGIRIDRDGTWYFEGAEMFRREIVNFFYQHLRRDEHGAYIIELPGDPGDRCYVDVEDTAFVVRSAELGCQTEDGRACILIRLSDESQEVLAPDTLRTGTDHVLYCKIREGRFEARFSRAGYYQLTQAIEYDEENDIYFLRLNDQRYDIQKP